MSSLPRRTDVVSAVEYVRKVLLRKLDARTVDHVFSARESVGRTVPMRRGREPKVQERRRKNDNPGQTAPLLDELQSSCPEARILRMPCLFSTMASLSKIIGVHSHSILAFGESALVQLAGGLV